MTEIALFKPCRDGEHRFCTAVKFVDGNTICCVCACGHPEESRAQQNLFPRQLTLALVLRRVSEAKGVPQAAIASSTKGVRTTWDARNLFYQVARLCEFTTVEIAAWMSRDHSTIVQCSQRIEDIDLAQALHRELTATSARRR